MVAPHGTERIKSELARRLGHWPANHFQVGGHTDKYKQVNIRLRSTLKPKGIIQNMHEYLSVLFYSIYTRTRTRIQQFYRIFGLGAKAFQHFNCRARQQNHFQHLQNKIIIIIMFRRKHHKLFNESETDLHFENIQAETNRDFHSDSLTLTAINGIVRFANCLFR